MAKKKPAPVSSTKNADRSSVIMTPTQNGTNTDAALGSGQLRGSYPVQGWQLGRAKDAAEAFG